MGFCHHPALQLLAAPIGGDHEVQHETHLRGPPARGFVWKAVVSMAAATRTVCHPRWENRKATKREAQRKRWPRFRTRSKTQLPWDRQGRTPYSPHKRHRQLTRKPKTPWGESVSEWDAFVAKPDRFWLAMLLRQEPRDYGAGTNVVESWHAFLWNFYGSCGKRSIPATPNYPCTSLPLPTYPHHLSTQRRGRPLSPRETSTPAPSPVKPEAKRHSMSPLSPV